MNQAEMIEKISEKTHQPKADITKTVQAMSDVMFEELQNDKGFVSIPNIGKVSQVEKAEKEGRNPRTGEKMVFPAGKRVKFTASKNLKTAINSKP